MHPTMLYEIAFNLAAALVLWRWRDRVPAPGDALKLYLLAAATFRFLVEFIRTSPPQAFGLTAPQWVLIPMIALLLIHFARQSRRRAWRVPQPPPAFNAVSADAVVRQGGHRWTPSRARTSPPPRIAADGSEAQGLRRR